MTYDFEPNHDHIVATFLPWTRQWHETQLEQVREFTTDEARQLYMDGRPLLMNHHDGEVDPHTQRQTDFHPVGVIHASNVTATDAKILASIDPYMSEEAMLSSNKVALGEYKSVSLGQTVETCIKSGAGGYAVFVKTPKEVSLCRQGRREGSEIELYCPGRATIERLAEHAPDDLETLIDVHGYRPAVIDSGVTDKKSRQYIDAVVAVSRNRLVRAVGENQLFQRPPPQQTMSDKASQEQSQEPAPPTTADTGKTETAAPPDAAVKSEQKPEAATPAVETPATPNMSSLKDMTDAALKYKTESVERAKELAEMKERLAKAEAAEAKLNAIEQEKKDRIKREFETAIKSLEQYGAVAKIPRENLDFQVEAAKDMFEANPTRSLNMVKSALVMAAKASSVTRAEEEANATRLAQAAKAVDQRFFAEAMSKFRELDQREAAFMSGAIPPSATIEKTSFEQRFASSTSDDMSHLGGVAERAAASEDTTSATKRPAARMSQVVEKQPPALFVRASNNSDVNDFDAAGCFAELFKQTGVLPSYSQVAMGEAMVATGKFQASADGQSQVPVFKRQRTRQTAAAIEPANFDPAWDSMLQRAMVEGSFGVRNPMAMKRTSAAMPDIELPM